MNLLRLTLAWWGWFIGDGERFCFNGIKCDKWRKFPIPYSAVIDKISRVASGQVSQKVRTAKSSSAPSIVPAQRSSSGQSACLAARPNGRGSLKNKSPKLAKSANSYKSSESLKSFRSLESFKSFKSPKSFELFKVTQSFKSFKSLKTFKSFKSLKTRRSATVCFFSLRSLAERAERFYIKSRRWLDQCHGGVARIATIGMQLSLVFRSGKTVAPSPRRPIVPFPADTLLVQKKKRLPPYPATRSVESHPSVLLALTQLLTQESVSFRF